MWVVPEGIEKEKQNMEKNLVYKLKVAVTVPVEDPGRIGEVLEYLLDEATSYEIISVQVVDVEEES